MNTTTTHTDAQPNAAAHLRDYHAKRAEDTERRLIHGARALLAAGGIENFTVEKVAAATGIAKTTIYRRYANAVELATAAAGQTTSRGEDGRELDPDVLTLVAQAEKQIDPACVLSPEDRAAGAEVLLARALGAVR